MARFICPLHHPEVGFFLPENGGVLLLLIDSVKRQIGVVGQISGDKQK